MFGKALQRILITASASLAAIGMAATTTASAATAGPSPASTRVEVCGQGPALQRPDSVILTCADDGELVENLYWTSWTGAFATAIGDVTWRRSCALRCAAGRHWESATARISLIDPAVEPDGELFFTKLELHTTGVTPQGFMRDLTFDERPVASSAAMAAKESAVAATSKPSATAPAPAAPAASGTLDYASIEGYWIDAGGPSSAAGIAAAITGAESSFLPGIIQPGVDYCGSGADRAGWGLWQITCGDSTPAYGTDFQLLDPWNNAEAAVAKYVEAGGFSPWSTYTSGAYESYLQITPANAALTDPGEYVQVNSTPPGTPLWPAANPGSRFGPAMPVYDVSVARCSSGVGNCAMYLIARSQGSKA